MGFNERQKPTNEQTGIEDDFDFSVLDPDTIKNAIATIEAAKILEAEGITGQSLTSSSLPMSANKREIVTRGQFEFTTAEGIMYLFYSMTYRIYKPDSQDEKKGDPLRGDLTIIDLNSNPLQKKTAFIPFGPTYTVKTAFDGHSGPNITTDSPIKELRGPRPIKARDSHLIKNGLEILQKLSPQATPKTPGV